MSGALAASARMRAALIEPMAGIAAAVRAARDAQAEFTVADDIMEVLAGAANLAIACEAMQKAAKDAETALRTNTAKVMESIGSISFETTGHTVSISKGKKSVEIIDASAVPPDLMTTPAPQPDKKKIAAFLKGKTVNWARTVQGGPVLTIRNGGA